MIQSIEAEPMMAFVQIVVAAARLDRFQIEREATNDE